MTFAGRFFDHCFTAPERITAAEWSEQHRRLSPEASAKGGLFSFETNPWQREVLELVSDPTCGRIVLQWASQVTGKTETLINAIGYHVDVDPCPMLIIQPTLEMAEAFSKDRIATLARDTPRLRNKILDPRSRNSGNTILHKAFPGGHLTMAGANSPAGLASRPIRVVIFDEVDRFDASAGTEGDPIALAQQRTKSFPDALALMVSTPTLKGASRIESEYLASDQRQWHCPCPRCGEHQVLDWSQVHWREDDPRECWIECAHCHAHLNDGDRIAMVRAGQWRATVTGATTAGFQLNGLVCLFGAQRPYVNRLQQMVADYLHAKKIGDEAIKVWTNTFLAETYEPPSETLEPHQLYQRRETYPEQIPGGACILVKSVDVQGDRLEILTEAYGPGDECWTIEHCRIMGNPAQPTLWRDLSADIRREYRHETGHNITASIVAIDEGYRTDDVRKFVRANRPPCIAVKGDPKAGALLMRYQKKPVQGVRSYLIGTDTAKDKLMSRLRLDEMGPGYQHFPDTADCEQEFFDQLTAEKLRIIIDAQGRAKRAWWKPKHARNEILDLKVYSLGAWEVYKHHKRPDLKQLLASLHDASEPDPIAEDDPTRRVREYQLDQPSPAQVQRTRRAGRPRARKGFVKGW